MMWHAGRTEAGLSPSTRWLGPGRRAVGLLFGLSMWICIPAIGFATSVILVSTSDEVWQLQYQVEGKLHTETIPLYRQGKARYLSAGVGIEERSAIYPSFPLKLVFTAGGRPYVAGVTVTVEAVNSSLQIGIPPEEITGPWLFLDLPDGTYHISATMEKRTERLTHVKVEHGRQRTLYMRWPEDRGATRNDKDG